MVFTLPKDRLLKHVVEGKTKGKIRQERRRTQILEIERGSNRSRSLRNWFWKWLQTCPRHYVMIRTITFLDPEEKITGLEVTSSHHNSIYL